MKKTTLTLLMIVLMAAPTTLLAKKDSRSSSEKENSREALRAFYTAPPIIPHEVDDQINQESCLQCHKDGRKMGGRVAKKTPHPQFFNCLQCHVQKLSEGKDWTETNWQGLKKPGKIKRANSYAPPVIPHRLFLRKNCLSCHSPKNPDKVLRTPHPERSNCRQCHVAEKNRDF